jgi:hypothetical protein
VKILLVISPGCSALWRGGARYRFVEGNTLCSLCPGCGAVWLALPFC